MENKKTAVFGIYTTVPSADSATDQLVRSGFSAAEVSALLPENLGTRPLGTEKAMKAPEGAATGAGSGAVLGGALGLLAGMGALAIPGVGPLLQKGAILLSVHCDTADEIKRAKEIMKNIGAEDISSTGESSPNVAKPNHYSRWGATGALESSGRW